MEAVLIAGRENLMLGVSQIKLARGAGVQSNFDPIDVTELLWQTGRGRGGALADLLLVDGTL